MPRLAKQVTKEQVITALDYIIKNKLELNGSTVHNLVYKGNTFPPKEVVRCAARLAKIPDWENMGLSGGEDTNKPLRAMGFEIVNKLPGDINLALIKKYKQLVVNGNEKEIYKWQLIEKYKGRPSLDAADFGNEIASINYQNLIFHNGIAVRNHMAKEKPEEYRAAFRKLFDEGSELGKRVVEFQQDIDLIYKSMGQTLHHHHDERSIATFLSFHSPEKYILYKNSFYTRYCTLLGVKQAKRNEKYGHYLVLAQDFIDNYVNVDKELITIKEKFLADDCYQDTKNLIFAQDILYQTLDGDTEENIEDELLPIEKDEVIMYKPALNQILYGPPGTGKTYHTINKALSIIERKSEHVLALESRQVLKERYQSYVTSGQIAFTTFHQSMSYEDFVEGIKPQAPVTDDGNISYEIEPGIFKGICETAKTPINLTRQPKDVFEKVKFFKMSIGGKNRPDIHDWCLENDVVGLGYGNDADFSEINKIKDWNQYRDAFKQQFPTLVDESKYHIQAMFIFQRMQIGDIVIITKGNHVIDAIGKIVSEYHYDEDTPNDYYQFRKVEWLAKNINQHPSIFFNKNISQQSIYEFFDADVKKEAFKAFFEQKPLAHKNYVLIIDEINRGNVSAIFGELITLIEESKRTGAAEALEITLPYSKEKFSVPSNLYIVGTMNTADRSVEALDTALRRRFAFEEMMPLPGLLNTNKLIYDALWRYENIAWGEQEWIVVEKGLHELFDFNDKWQTEKEDLWDSFKANGKTSIDIPKLSNYHKNQFNLEKLLTTINQRIEVLLDRDHQIGHSYFIDVNSLADLKAIFYDKIIPLLQEYFYGDYAKIGLVLGTGFIKQQMVNANVFSNFDPELASNYEEKQIYYIKDYRNGSNLAASETFEKAISTLLNQGVDATQEVSV